MTSLLPSRPSLERSRAHLLRVACLACATGLAAVLAIQDACNAARGDMPAIDLINAEEKARIEELIQANTWPMRWSGEEMRADTPTDDIRRDGSIQAVMLELIAVEKGTPAE